MNAPYITGLHIWYVHSAYEMVWAVKHNQIYVSQLAEAWKIKTDLI